jgi:hypothetical protein
MTDFTDTRRDLIALRTKHGADIPIGHRCSSLVEMIPNFEAATDKEQKARLTVGIQKKTAELARLLSAAQ